MKSHRCTNCGAECAGPPKSDPRVPPTPIQAAEDMSHIGYEAKMCAWTAAQLAAVHAAQSPITYALLESHLIHMRNLIEFLVMPGDKRRQQDMLRQDYLRHWHPRPSADVDLLKQLKPDIDTHVAHLSRVRTHGSRGWHFMRQARAALAVLEAWTEALEPATPALAALLRRDVEEATQILAGTSTSTVMPTGAQGATGPGGPWL